MRNRQIDKIYDPKKVEDKWYDFWLKKNYFAASPNKDKKPYVIVIPPPNVTDILHAGHAFNNTIQDIYIRYKRKKGFETLWQPGTDHAGIATQNVVERNLAKENITRHDLGREKFVEKVWEWREKYGSTIIHQLKKLGCSCDWSRERFTMDYNLSNAVKEIFVRLYEKDLIYKGKYIINWCPRCSTALSDEEVEHRESAGQLWYFMYPYKDKQGAVVVATTRPETMLGDTAVAVNPKDKRYKHLIGKTLILPLMDREIPVVADEFVDPEFGTGAVKVTPAHDPNDFLIGERH
ncbi:MAG: class I tRNA ligase family protein, partial [Calditrichia bacterium]|nr:class I tRNA ligase family protein [Calditrichia bacterium]